MLCSLCSGADIDFFFVKACVGLSYISPGVQCLLRSFQASTITALPSASVICPLLWNSCMSEWNIKLHLHTKPPASVQWNLAISIPESVEVFFLCFAVDNERQWQCCKATSIELWRAWHDRRTSYRSDSDKVRGADILNRCLRSMKIKPTWQGFIYLLMLRFPVTKLYTLICTKINVILR